MRGWAVLGRWSIAVVVLQWRMSVGFTRRLTYCYTSLDSQTEPGRERERGGGGWCAIALIEKDNAGLFVCMYQVSCNTP